MNLESDISEKLVYDPRFRMYNFYLDVRNLFKMVYIKLGRQPIYNTIGGGVFDGLTLGINYKGFNLSGYYGGNVPAYQKFEFTDDVKNDFVGGANLTVTAITNTRVTLRYVNKNFKNIAYNTTRLDSDFNTIPYLIDNPSQQFEYVSADISYSQPKTFRIDTRYFYDLNYSNTSRFEISGRYDGVDNLGLTAYYNYRKPFVRYNSIFSVFDFRNSQEIEVGADYLIENTYKLIGKFANVSYEDESSQRISLALSSRFGTITGRKTFGYAGELDAISFYTAHTVLNGLLTPSFSFAYTRYKLSSAISTNEMVTLLLGCNYRPIRTLSFDVQGQYVNNKIYNNDYRLFVKLNFWFNHNFNR
ncbi:MAG: hypothetical protein JSW63_01005 [Ignavibacterium sp.]|nr:MAG: hypothetical protein JSW63_01005 [Ignavibacterium sp.]